MIPPVAVVPVNRSCVFRHIGAQRVPPRLVYTTLPHVQTRAKVDQYYKRFGLTGHPSSGIIGYRYQVTNTVPWIDILNGDGGPSRTRTCDQRIMSPLL